MKKLYCVICGKYIVEKIYNFSIICSKCENEYQKIIKKDESIEMLNILGLFKNI